VVVADRVVGGAAVVVGALVVVGRLGARVVSTALVGGRVLGGVVAAEVSGTVGAGARSPTVELVELDRSTVVGRGARLPPPGAAATPVVGTGHGRSPQPDDGPGLLNTWRASTSTIPAAATAVATQ
jgi:hypothetical protein